ncbi:unnamed protein product, partial [Closterium sp. NIES-64]
MDEAMVPSIRFLAHCCGDRLGPEAAKQVEREVRGGPSLAGAPRTCRRLGGRGVSAQVETRLVQVVVGQFNLLPQLALSLQALHTPHQRPLCPGVVLLDDASSELKKHYRPLRCFCPSCALPLSWQVLLDEASSELKKPVNKSALHGAVLASLFSGEEPALADALQVKLVNDR